MSELNDEILDEIEDGNVEDVTEDDIRDSLVITVPIDSTLSISGAAADARAAGQALNAKASESDVKTLLSVNGRTGNGTWAIMVNGGNIPASSDTDTEMVSDALDRIAGSVHDEEVARVQSLVQVYNRITPLEAHAGLFVQIDFTEAGTIQVTDERIAAQHFLTGCTWLDGQGNVTGDVLADLTWTTAAGELTVVIDRVWSAGSVIMNFGWRADATPEEVTT